jgi:hypothetical protein
MRPTGDIACAASPSESSPASPRPIPVEQQLVHVGAHAQTETLIAFGMIDQEIEEIPLRHERDELAVSRQMFEVGKEVPMRALNSSTFGAVA